MNEKESRNVHELSECEKCFLEWVQKSHYAAHFEIERKAFCAGWSEAMRQRWKERND